MDGEGKKWELEIGLWVPQTLESIWAAFFFLRLLGGGREVTSSEGFRLEWLL